MEELFTDAGIPLVHIPTSESYDSADVISLFQIAVTKVGKTTPLHLVSTNDNVPQCPICGKMMVLRINRNGSHSGKTYYGCIDSPRCRGVVAIG